MKGQWIADKSYKDNASAKAQSQPEESGRKISLLKQNKHKRIKDES